MHSLMSVLITFEITKAFKHCYVYMYIRRWDFIPSTIYIYILLAINMRKYLRDTKLS